MRTYSSFILRIDPQVARDEARRLEQEIVDALVAGRYVRRDYRSHRRLIAVLVAYVLKPTSRRRRAVARRWIKHVNRRALRRR